MPEEAAQISLFSAEKSCLGFEMHLKMKISDIRSNCKASEQMIRLNHEERTYRALKMCLTLPSHPHPGQVMAAAPSQLFTKDQAKEVFPPLPSHEE